MQERTGWAIRAMNHGMAVHATTCSRLSAWVLQGACGVVGRQTTLKASGIGAYRTLTIVRAIVTLLAQERRTRFQQRRDVGAVRRMAVRAILGRRLVFPQEGAAFFGMAGVASLGHRVLLEQFGTGRTVRIVAVGTDDLTGIDRVG